MISLETKDLLWQMVSEYRNSSFIADDPIQIPHQFSQKQNIEISAFFASILAWGQRKSIIRSCERLMVIMDNNPYQFLLDSSIYDLDNIPNFVHRTFNRDDLIFLLKFLKSHYQENESLETAFFPQKTSNENLNAVKEGLIHFKSLVWKSIPKNRTSKHISSPEQNSSCKRLNMFLRWMVRPSDSVDFGIWNNINPSQLMIPLDVHVFNVATQLELIPFVKVNWNTCELLTQELRKINPEDPIIFDFALFGMGVNRNFK